MSIMETLFVMGVGLAIYTLVDDFFKNEKREKGGEKNEGK